MKDILEREANCFARHCSCPIPLVKNILTMTDASIDLFSLFEIMFCMSPSVTLYSTNHFSKYSDYYSLEKYEKLTEKFGDSLDEILDILEINKERSLKYKSQILFDKF